MAQWKETLEPYIKVYERIKTATIAPTAGESLIIGATIISDSGPAEPVLITSQREFLDTYASRDLTKEYVESLNELYDGDDSELASTMWLNAYRLSGSGNLLIVRATKTKGMNFIKPIGSEYANSLDKYIIRDGQILKKVPSFKLIIDTNEMTATHPENGWAINVNEIGVIGNLTSDEGPEYTYLVNNLKELVDYLNDTPKFFSPKYYFINNNVAFSEIDRGVIKNNGAIVDTATASVVDPDNVTSETKVVYFEEVYLAANFLDKTTDSFTYPSTVGSDNFGSKNDGLAYLITAKEGGVISGSGFTNTVDLNGTPYSDFTEPEYYAVNTYNSNTDLRVRIRRFNHDAVVTREIPPTINDSEDSPYIVLTDILKVIKASGNTERDFYEIAVLDPSLDSDPLYFNVGNIPGRGDMTIDEVNEALKMIDLHLPYDLKDLGLDYYTNTSWEELTGTNIVTNTINQFPNTPIVKEKYKDNYTSYPKVITYPDSYVPAAAEWTSDEEEWDIAVYSNTTKRISVSGIVYNTDNGDEVPCAGVTVSIVGATPSASMTTGEDGKFTLTGTSTSTELTALRFEKNGFQTIDGEFTGSTTVGNTHVGINNNVTVVMVEASDDSTVPRLIVSLTTEPENNDIFIQGQNISELGYSESQFHVLRTFVGDTIASLKVYGRTGVVQLSTKLGIEKDSSILHVSDDDMMRAMTEISEDEIYTTEGLTDLGCTSLKFQTYLCNMAKNENYFYPISTVRSTNYLTIANYRTKLAQDSYKLYTSAPWDVDTGTVGFKFYASPSTIYWEAVNKNRSMDREFASVFGFGPTGQVLYTNPVTEFTKKQRQLLLSKQINTVLWYTQGQTWNMNDCYTMTSENHILNEDGNSRLFIRINKAIPTLLKPLIGRKLNGGTYREAEEILKYWFKMTILPMQYGLDAYRITVSDLAANDDMARRQNKMYVLVECRFQRSLKYIIVYSDALDMGVPFTGEI